MPAAWYLSPVTYTATAEIRFLSVRPKILQEGNPSGVTASYEKFVSTQAMLIAGNTILSRVLLKPAVMSLPEVSSAPDGLAYLSDIVSARQNSGSELMTVRCTLADRNAALTILQAVVDEYMDYAKQKEAQVGGVRLQILVDERKKSEDSLQLLTEQVRALKLKVDPQGEHEAVTTDPMELYRTNLDQAENDRSRAQFEQQSLEARLESAKAGTDDSEPVLSLAEIENRVNADPRVTALQQELAAAQSRLEEETNRYVAGAPQVRKAEQRITSLEERIASTKATVRKDAHKWGIDDLKSQVEAAKNRVAEAEDRVAKYKEKMVEISKTREDQAGDFTRLSELQDKIAERRLLIAELSQQITDLSLESNAPAQVELPAPPSVPSSPDRMPKLAGLALAMLASLGTGIGVAAIREFSDQKLRTPGDVERFARAPVLACLPHSSEDPALESPDFIASLEKRLRSVWADQVRRILGSIVYPSGGSAGLCSVLVTSPTRGDGKTTVACSLAVALAQASRPVLLVDLSHRKPEVEACFGLEPGPGLAEILLGQRRFHEVARRTRIRNLTILGPGLVKEGLSHRLVSEEMFQLQELAEHEFMHVIFDSPPELVMSEALLLAPLVDGVMLVAGVETTSRGMLQRCLNDMLRVGAEVFGVVLNGVRAFKGGYLRDNYDLHYEYGDVPQIDAVPAGSTKSNSRAGEREPAVPLLLLADEKEKSTDDQRDD